MLDPKGVSLDINPSSKRMVCGFLSRHYKLVFATMGVKYIQEIADYANKGVLKPTIGQEYPFTKAIMAITNTENGSTIPGKTVLTF